MKKFLQSVIAADLFAAFLFVVAIGCIMGAVVSVVSCTSDAELARKASAGNGLQDPLCIHHSGKYENLDFCTDGKKLAICEHGDECIFVNLAAEKE